MRSARGDVRDHVAQGEVFLLTRGHLARPRTERCTLLLRTVDAAATKVVPRGWQNGMIQINAVARLPPKVAHGIKTAFHHRSGRARGIVVSVVIIALVLFSMWAELEGRGALVPLLLAFPPHRFALWVLRLEPHLRRPLIAAVLQKTAHRTSLKKNTMILSHNTGPSRNPLQGAYRCLT